MYGTCSTYTKGIFQTFLCEGLSLASSKRSVDPVPLLTGVSGIMELGEIEGKGGEGRWGD